MLDVPEQAFPEAPTKPGIKNGATKSPGRKPHYIAFLQSKGGVGKSTLLCSVAYNAVAEKGLNVYVVDTDYPQYNASSWVKKVNARQKTAGRLDFVKVESYRDIERAIKGYVENNSESPPDLILIDTPGVDSAQAAMTTASVVNREGGDIIIPTKPSGYDLAQVAPTLTMIKSITGNDIAAHICVVINEYLPHSKIYQDAMETLKSELIPNVKKSLGIKHLRCGNGLAQITGIREFTATGIAPTGRALETLTQFIDGNKILQAVA